MIVSRSLLLKCFCLASCELSSTFYCSAFTLFNSLRFSLTLVLEAFISALVFVTSLMTMKLFTPEFAAVDDVEIHFSFLLKMSLAVSVLGFVIKPCE